MLQQFLQDCEDNFDSISQISESTQASELVAQRIADYNNVLPIESINADRTPVVNIHIKAVKIYGDNEGGFLSLFQLCYHK